MSNVITTPYKDIEIGIADPAATRLKSQTQLKVIKQTGNFIAE